jgi:hypothetical protein
MRVSTVQKLVLITGMVFSQGAAAGEFSVACSYTNENVKGCANKIADLVTDKFVAKFPAAEYQIFVHSDIHNYTDGGYAAYAVAGVVPKGLGQFPISKFASSNINGTNKMFTRIQLADQELKTFRKAVSNLMEQCEISPTCDVYVPRKQ